MGKGIKSSLVLTVKGGAMITLIAQTVRDHSDNMWVPILVHRQT